MRIKIPSFIWRSIFAVAYTFTVLPFTVSFFKKMTQPSGDVKLLSMSLIDGHNLMLPVFLAALEFSSINLACRFWQQPSSRARMVLLALLLACQAYPVTAVYYDMRSRDYNAAKEEHNILARNNSDALDSQQGRLESQIKFISGDTREMRRETAELNRTVSPLLRVTESDKSVSPDISAELGEIGKQRRQNGSMLRNLHQRQMKLYGELQKTIGEKIQQYKDQAQGFTYRTELEYIVGNLKSLPSGFAFFFAMLFPVSILSVSFALPKNPEIRPGELPRIDLRDHFQNAASLPADMHRHFVKTMLPAIEAHIAGLMAAKTVLNKNDELSSENHLVRDVIAAIKELQAQVAGSSFEEGAKQYLISALDGSLRKNLIKEELHNV